MSANVDLSDLADALVAATPDLDANGQRIFRHTHRLLALGEPLVPADIANAVGISAEWTAELLRSWPLALWDDQGRVVGF